MGRSYFGSGWLHKQDIKIEELAKQQSTIAKYLDTVDEVLFGGRKDDPSRIAWLAGTAGGRVCHCLIRT
jgi:hypothetical protein